MTAGVLWPSALARLVDAELPLATRAIGAVQHPNILAVFDAGLEAETPYLVMELASGGSLRERVKAGKVPPETVRQVGIQIARALAAAHAAGIVHRDVKPANILALDGGLWKLADFGIARVPDSTLTITGQFLGSPSYAAPESLRNGEFGPASDVYGLGSTLYEAVTGAPPHGDHDMRSLIRKLEKEPTHVSSIVAVPGPFGDAIMAALARDPAKRPSAEQLAAMLANTDPPSRSVVAAAPATAVGSRRWWYAIAALAAVGLLALILRSRDHASSPMRPGMPALTAPVEAAPAGASSDTDGSEDATADHPQVFDEHGNPVDEETARQVLEQLEREREHEEAEGGGRGRKHKKHKDR